MKILSKLSFNKNNRMRGGEDHWFSTSISSIVILAILAIFLSFCMINSVSAADLNKTSNSNKNAELEDGCSAVVVQINKTDFVYGYRRDSSYAANLHIKKVRYKNKLAVKEYKTKNGYFPHTIVFKDGWFVSVGGADKVNLVKYLEKIGTNMVTKGKITQVGFSKAYKTVKKLGIGHFLIKSPSGHVKAISNFYGFNKKYSFKLNYGEYVIIPNSPKYFKKGKLSSKKLLNSEKITLVLLAKDPYGDNRRNIVIYRVSNVNNKTHLKVFAGNDNGNYVGRSTSNKKDNIYFLSKFIKSSALKIVPLMTYLGLITL
ncbi:hypothetical protein MBCUT_17630 [Methanobrevibacter cuticularis]|uniref:Uncharacterized protein n=1 Tax=Methanobrevibacter cuticularis TaxID=47311 RepID=A0A166CZY1_9EURY|nr:hypothetical protein [Methanobrevibacter cuticularis]KZX15053.1 hypothetical protein MBCUT_17630 [Methanobrevibacter cuticularis]